MAGGFTLGPKSGVMQMGGDVQAGAAPATIKASLGEGRPAGAEGRA